MKPEHETKPESETRHGERRFEMSLEIGATRESVWNAISRGEEIRRWFAPEAHVEPRVGGEILWRWGERYTWPQTIEVWEPLRRLRTRYDSQVPDGRGGRRPLCVDFTLEGKGGRTTLRIVQAGFGPEAAFDKEYDGIRHGWPGELRSLRTYLEHHAGEDRALAWLASSLSLDRTAAWKLLTGEQGFRCASKLQQIREGARVRMDTATGDVFEGEVLATGEYEIYVLLPEMDHAFLRVSIEDDPAGALVWLWLEAWGKPQAWADALRARWEVMVAKLFAARAVRSEPKRARG